MRKYLIAAIGAVLILALAVGVVLALEGGQRQAAGQPAPTPAPEGAAPTAQAPSSVDVVAEAAVVPVQHAVLSMPVPGIVGEILVREDQPVEAGQVILHLQDAHQQAALAQAQAGLKAAQAQLAALQAGPRDQEIAAAQANLDAAQARLARMEEKARPAALAAAQAALAAAQAAVDRLDDGPTEQARIAAEAELKNAEAVVRQAQAAYDRVASEPDVAMRPESVQLEQATNQYDAAKARYDALFAPPEADVVAEAQAQVKEAQANLDRLQTPATKNEIGEVAALVRQAQAQLDLLLAGASPEEIAAAQASVAEAEAAVQQAQAGVADTELRAPFAGTVAGLDVKVGEPVVPGTPVAEVADLSAWQIETDDLTELDIGRVAAGDRVVLTFDAIPGLELGGKVERIEAIGRENQGDITYTVIVRPDEQDPRLRWNMTAVVTVQ